MDDVLSQPLSVVAIYAAINALIMLMLGMLVVRARVKTRTEIGDGNDPSMIGPMRAHANNTETVPMAIVLLFILYALGEGALMLHVVGLLLTVGRLLHAFGLSRNIGTSIGRFGGMLLTWLAYIVAIADVLWMAFAYMPAN
ncbi:MAG: MAPEG family protein [Proteobacteria bacterium]|nr:MAPEG family protein [Pseudomonadota bacterium]